MVSNMNIEPKGELCDTNRPILTNSAISQNSIECQLNHQQDNRIDMVDADELTKKVLKLDLSERDVEKGSFDSDEKCSSANLGECKSPKSPLSNACK